MEVHHHPNVERKGFKGYLKHATALIVRFKKSHGLKNEL